MIQGLQDWQVCLVFQEKMEPLDKRLVHLSLQSICFTPSIPTVHLMLTLKPGRQSVYGQGKSDTFFSAKKFSFEYTFLGKASLFLIFWGGALPYLVYYCVLFVIHLMPCNSEGKPLKWLWVSFHGLLTVFFSRFRSHF